MTDYSLDSKSIVINAINTDHGTFIALNDVDFVSITSNTTGAFNTTANMLARSTGNYRDNVEINYNRTPLNQTFPQPIVSMVLGNIATTTDLIARINTQYNKSIGIEDVVFETISPAPVNESISVFTLKASATSLAYIGTVDVYFSTVAILKEWVRYPTFEYSVDGKTFSISGTAKRINGAFIVGKKGTILPASDSVAVTLDDTGVFGLATSYPLTGLPKVRLSAGQVIELVGPSGETSYDQQGALLPALPVLPPAFNKLSALLNLTGSPQAGVMNFSTDFTVKDFFLPFGNVAYVDGLNGADGNLGTDPLAPLKTLTAAFNKTPQVSTIYLKNSGVYSLDTVINNRQLTIISTDAQPAVISGGLLNLTWTRLAQTSTYTTPIIQPVVAVMDYSTTGSTSEPIRLAQYNSQTALTSATNGGFFSDGTTLSVRTSNARQPDAAIIPIKTNSGIHLTGSSSVYLENLTIQDTNVGLLAESLDTTNKPSLYAKSVTLKTTATLFNVNSFGATIYLENVSGMFGYAGGSCYAGDRNSISLGVSSTFIELNCTYSTFTGAGVGMCKGTTAQRGSLGVRVNSVYSNVSGYPVHDFGVSTATANYGIGASNNTISDVKSGALVVSGTDTLGLSGRCVQLILSAVMTNPSKFTFATLGSGEQHLYNTPVGAVGQYGKVNPYNFVYTSIN